MAISSERFEGTKNRNWLSSVHGISTVPTFKCNIVGAATKDLLIPSGSPVIVSANGTARVILEGETIPTFAAGDQLGFTISDRVPDEDGETQSYFLNAATLMHGRIRYSFLSDVAKAAVDAAVEPGDLGVAPSFQFVVHRQ